ncbi:NAD(P)/FAD-dependent oxidoreductase [Bordetella genomosp. 12]|uniref:Ferredoxin-NAD reductase n=1 Tax=Bordetella genomosp. 12 TaxID=463035 RepID=A0A261VSM0_9BORD|nr:FAD-dependent oxidoreductase [Bordetella genomosp. 12]OZI77104.1 ferredoxin-NAD reductase [Bordetella genomosp. 12]
MKRFVFIGGGVAAATAARELRSAGFAGEIIIVCDEPDLPYERPPLSKDWLTGQFDRSQFRINPQDWYAQNDVTVLLSTRATRIDVEAHEVALSDGRSLTYDALIIATGVRAKTLPGFSGERVHVMRSLEDSERLRHRLIPGQHLAVLGAGFLGCEVAAFAAEKGLRVTVFDPGALPLGRAVCQEIGRAVIDIHREHGVQMRTGEIVAKLKETPTGVELTTGRGEVVVCDDVLVAIGSIPNVELAEQAGIEVDGGILTDEYGRTSAPDVYAIGDVAARFHPVYGRMFRVEHHDTAMRHGINIARNLMDQPQPFTEEHFFWSQQYEHSLQAYGQAVGDCVEVIRGSAADRSLSVFSLEGKRIKAIISLNRPQDLMQARKIMAIAHEVTKEQLADPAFDLKSLLPRPVRPQRREVNA